MSQIYQQLPSTSSVHVNLGHQLKWNKIVQNNFRFQIKILQALEQASRLICYIQRSQKERDRVPAQTFRSSV
jgi:hypothetical protein